MTAPIGLGAELTIARLHGAQEGKVIRIDVRFGREVLSRVELTPDQLCRCLMGELIVVNYFSGKP